MDRKNNQRIIGLILAVILCVSSFTGCGKRESTGEYFTSVHQLNGKTVAAWVGSNIYMELLDTVPGAEVVPLETLSDMIIALADGKIDAFGQADFRSGIIRDAISNMTCLDDFSVDVDCAFAFPDTDKGSSLKTEFNMYIKSLTESGELEKLRAEWVSDLTPHGLSEELNSWDGSEGVVTVGASTNAEPFCYQYSGNASGYEMALLCGFCREMHYEIKLEQPNFAGMITGIGSGQYDIGLGGIEITSERAQTLNFSVPTYSYKGVIYVLSDPNQSVSYTQTSQLNGLKAGVATGTIADAVTKEQFPDSEILYFKTNTDCAEALILGKIDYFISDRDYLMVMAQTEEALYLIDEPLYPQEIGAIFAKDDPDSDILRMQFDEFITNHKDEIDAMKADWIWNYETRTSADIEFDPNGKPLAVATETVGAPFGIMRDNKLEGFEIELVRTFCKEYGYVPSFSLMDFGSMLSAVAVGKADIGIDSVCITEERKENVNFSVPYSSCPEIAVTLKHIEKPSFVDRLRNSIYKNLLLENRWKLILSGVETTLGITLVAAVLGTILGFILYLLCRRSRGILPKILNFLAWLISGLPMVVMLMILYYVVFSKSSISSVAVSIIGFTVSLMLSVYSLLTTAVKSIGKDQLEGAYSVGLTDRQAFFKIILPQALVQFIPNYQNALVALIQGTAIVGYIAVEDLTKVSDIIRSRTYEAFFPLIITALIYLILGSLLTRIVRRIQINVDPRRRSQAKIMEKFKS